MCSHVDFDSWQVCEGKRESNQNIYQQTGLGIMLTEGKTNKPATLSLCSWVEEAVKIQGSDVPFLYFVYRFWPLQIWVRDVVGDYVVGVVDMEE